MVTARRAWPIMATVDARCPLRRATELRRLRCAVLHQSTLLLMPRQRLAPSHRPKAKRRHRRRTNRQADAHPVRRLRTAILRLLQ